MRAITSPTDSPTCKLFKPESFWINAFNMMCFIVREKKSHETLPMDETNMTGKLQRWPWRVLAPGERENQGLASLRPAHADKR